MKSLLLIVALLSTGTPSYGSLPLNLDMPVEKGFQIKENNSEGRNTL
jgi:hypothetical protein